MNYPDGTPRTCGNCDYFDAETNGCRHDPPVVLALPMPKMVAGPVSASAALSQIQMQPVAMWPLVGAAMWCGQHSPAA